jgi:hypothetical protein
MAKRLVLFIILMLSMLSIPTQAQDSCDTAATNATAILDSAIALLQAGNTVGATTLITTARDSLATCTASGATVPAVQPTTVPAATNVAPEPTTVATEANTAIEPTAIPTEVTNTTTSTTSDIPAETTGIGDYVLIAPPVDIDNAIAFVRFAHTSIDAGSIDLYWERDTEPIVAGLDFGEVTELIPIPAGNWLITARRTGEGVAGEELYQMRWNYSANSSWVITAAGIVETFAFVVEPISIIRNDYNHRARVRIVNVAAGAPRSTVHTQEGQVLGDGLGWFGLRDNMLEPGTYTLTAETNTGSTLPAPLEYTFDANNTYTLLVMAGLHGAPLEMVMFATPQEISRVRFINNRIDVIDLHYRPGNELLIGNFDPQTETDWYEFPSGAITFVAVAPGAGARGREIAALPWQLRPDRDITIEINQNGMLVTDVVLRGYEN